MADAHDLRQAVRTMADVAPARDPRKVAHAVIDEMSDAEAATAAAVLAGLMLGARTGRTDHVPHGEWPPELRRVLGLDGG